MPPKELSIIQIEKRLKWDLYFLKIAKVVSENSKCMSRQIGAVLVKDNNVVSTGYNGPACGVKHCNERDYSFYLSLNKQITDNQHRPDYTILTVEKNWSNNICPRKNFYYKSGQGLHLCQAGHAERNALIQAAKHGISTDGAALYCYCPQVCKDCAIEIINAGIKELVFLDGVPYDAYAETILKESGILVRQVKANI